MRRAYSLAARASGQTVSRCARVNADEGGERAEQPLGEVGLGALVGGVGGAGGALVDAGLLQPAPVARVPALERGRVDLRVELEGVGAAAGPERLDAVCARAEQLDRAGRQLEHVLVPVQRRNGL